MAKVPKYTFEFHFDNNFSHGDKELNDIFAKFRGAFDETYPERKNYPHFKIVLECFMYITGRIDMPFVTNDAFMICKVCASVPELKEKYGKTLAQVLERSEDHTL